MHWFLDYNLQQDNMQNASRQGRRQKHRAPYKRTAGHEGIEKWDGDGFFDVHKKTVARHFRKVLKKGDDGVPGLQWDDFIYADEGLHTCEGDG